ncbi:MAG: 50S ribosomal protein L9 [Alphaproteobacteria bacterium]
MQVVLLERVEKLGQMGAVVKVKDGYARNFLLPRQKAMRATEENLKYFETRRVQLEATNLEHRKDAELVAANMEGKSFVILRQSGESGLLYGSVNSRDVASVMTENGYTVNRQQVALVRQIKSLGLHDVRIMLHPEVSAKIMINVARSAEEADKQAAGVNVLVNTDDDDDALDMELDELFDEGDEALDDAD